MRSSSHCETCAYCPLQGAAQPRRHCPLYLWDRIHAQWQCSADMRGQWGLDRRGAKLPLSGPSLGNRWESLSSLIHFLMKQIHFKLAMFVCSCGQWPNLNLIIHNAIHLQYKIFRACWLQCGLWTATLNCRCIFVDSLHDFMGIPSFNCTEECTRCSEPSPIEHGQLHAPYRSLFAEIEYTCDPSFTMFGSPTRVCGENGEWSGDQPTCFSKSPIYTYLPACYQ